MQDLKSAVLKSVRHAKGTGGGPPDKPPYVEEVLQILGDKNPLVSGIEGLCMQIFLFFYIFYCLHAYYRHIKKQTAYC